jgi:guanylate kinase
MAKYIALCGKSASGKNAIQDTLLSKLSFLKPIVSVTSRPIREGEKEGIDYKFVSHEQIMELLLTDKLIEHRVYYPEGSDDEWIYGISQDSIDKDSDNTYIVILDIKGLQEFINYVGKENVISFYIDASARTRLLRSLSREKNATDKQVCEFARRLLADDKDFDNACKYVDFCLNNETQEDFEGCIGLLTTWIENLRKRKE